MSKNNQSRVKVTFLGTGTSQGVPVIACECEVCTSLDFRDKRLRSSVQIETDGQTFVIDTGPDFRQQMLRNRTQRLDAVIFTHQHKDHTAGLDDIRSFNFRQKQDMPVYATHEVMNQIRQEFAYIFAEKKYPGAPMVQAEEIENQAFQINGTTVTPILVHHYKLPVFAYRIYDFTYITDANRIADEELEKVKGSKVMVVNALQKEKHISHFTLEQALEIIDKVQPERAYLTHLSHRMGTHAETEKLLPENVKIAYDGLHIEV